MILGFKRSKRVCSMIFLKHDFHLYPASFFFFLIGNTLCLGKNSIVHTAVQHYTDTHIYSGHVALLKLKECEKRAECDIWQRPQLVTKTLPPVCHWHHYKRCRERREANEKKSVFVGGDRSHLLVCHCLQATQKILALIEMD